MTHNGREQMDGRHQLHKTNGKFGEGRQGEGGDCGEDRVGVRDNVVTTQAGVDLGRVLSCLEVVSDRDDGKQNQDENGQRDQLGSPACVYAGCASQP
jgi:hypothetical protein